MVAGRRFLNNGAHLYPWEVKRMKQALLLIGMAVFFRLWGAALRRDRYVGLQAVGWIGCGIAAWLAVSAAGGWTPLWTGLAAGTVGALALRQFPNAAVFLLFDAAAVALAARFASPPFPPLSAAGLAAGMAIVAAVLETLVHRAPPAWVQRGRWTPLVLILLAAPFYWRDAVTFARYIRTTPGHWAFVAVAPVSYENPVYLPTGAVAWLDQPRHEKSDRAALFFHGAEPGGAHQSTAVAIRRTMVGAGLTVLSVDHPGFGLSPPPPRADVTSWDPLPTALSAYEALRKRMPADQIILVGHSMGCLDVLRLLNEGVPASGAILFGAGLPDEIRPEYRYHRFQRDRRLAAGALSFARYEKIRDRYYDGEKLLKGLNAGHPPVVFVAFDHEHADLASTRDRFFDLLPGPKIRVDFGPSTHYLNTVRLKHLMMGDTALASRLVTRFTDDLARLSAPDGESSVLAQRDSTRRSPIRQ